MATESASELLTSGSEALTESAFRTGEYSEAGDLLQAARVRAEDAGDRINEAAALNGLGWLMHFQAIDRGLENADADAEASLFEQALAIRREVADMAGVAESLFCVGLVHQVLRRDWAAAMPYFWDALALAEWSGPSAARSRSCNNRAGGGRQLRR